MIDTATLNRLKKVLSDQPIKLAYLFGSVSRGQENKNSDVDIAVVLENPRKYNILSLYSDVTGRVPHLNLDIREVDYNSDPLFAFNIIKSAQPLVVRNEQERIRFETTTMQRYYDTEPLRRINENYLKKSIKEETYGRSRNH